jgi:MerR family transcriptional regulator, light-induced transcriptional regulator
MTDGLTRYTHEDILDLLIKGDHLGCSSLVHNYLNNNISIQILYENIIQKALYHVGELWENNKISVAAEHLASAIVESVLNELYPKIISVEKTDKKVIVACIEDEFHQIGIKMISDIFELNGWNSYFLGANTPTNELIDFAKLINPNVLAISLSIYFHLPALEKMIKKIRQYFPNLLILVGGQAFLHGGREILNKYDNVFYKPDIHSVESFITYLNKNG